jgi:hypothetical protein
MSKKKTKKYIKPAPVGKAKVGLSDDMPDKFAIESKMPLGTISRNREQFDEANLQTQLRFINRKYGHHQPVKVIKTVLYKPVNGMLITLFEIFMT